MQANDLRLENGRTASNKMFLQWCRDELVLSFIFVQRFRIVGQDAASKRHHCRNTNVSGKPFRGHNDNEENKRDTEIDFIFSVALADNGTS